jgi:hypothetical protein
MDPMNGALLKSPAIGVLHAVLGWILGTALPGRGWRRSIDPAGATGLPAFGPFSSM